MQQKFINLNLKNQLLILKLGETGNCFTKFDKESENCKRNEID